MSGRMPKDREGNATECMHAVAVEKGKVERM